MGSKGVTPEHNAVVVLMRAFGPEVIERKHRDKFFKMLRIAPLPEKGDYFVDYFDYVKEHAPNALNDRDKDGNWYEPLAWRQNNRAARSPWSSEKCPLVAGWLAANEKSLLRVIEASNRSRFYVPAISEHDDNDMWVAFPVLSRLRDAVRALRARTMLRLQEGNAPSAWDDVHTVFRLSRLVAQGPTPNEDCVAITFDGIAHLSCWQVAHFARLTSEQTRQLRKAIGKLPPLPSVTEKNNLAGRFAYLDFVCAAARGSRKTPCVYGKLRDALIEWMNSGAVDWDQVLRWGNEHVDRMIEAAHKPTWRERLDTAAALDQSVEQQYAKFRNAKPSKSAKPTDVFRGQNQQPIATAGLFAVSSEWLLGPVTRMDIEAENRVVLDTQLTDLALALSEYWTIHGRYPKKLARIVPDHIARIPEDPYGKGPFQYRRQDDGYLLYSVGPNGVDDTGPHTSVSYPDDAPCLFVSDDIGIRMPDRMKDDDK